MKRQAPVRSRKKSYAPICITGILTFFCAIVCVLTCFHSDIPAMGVSSEHENSNPQVPEQSSSSSKQSSSDSSSSNPFSSLPDPSSSQEVSRPAPKPNGPYADLYPQMWFPTPCPTAPKQKTAYLTFDDGCSDNTAIVLDTLKAYNIKATFFIVGQFAQNRPDLLERIYKEGHGLGVHSTSHDYRKIYASVPAFLDDYAKTNELIKSVTGQYSPLLRYPGGSVNGVSDKKVMNSIKEEMNRRGVAYFDWNAVVNDAMYPRKTVQELYDCAVSTINVNRNVVLLMHDSGDMTETAKALPKIIEYLKRQGYVFDKLTSSSIPVQFGEN